MLSRPRPLPSPRHRLRSRPARRVRWLAAALALAAAALSGCSAKAGAASTAAPSTSDAAALRLGYFANVTHALPLVGVADGTYQRDLGSTRLSTQVFNAGPAAVEALFAGAIDAAYVGPNPAINAFVKSHGAAVRIVAGEASAGAELVVRPGITSAAQLKGQTLADPQLGGTQDVALRYWLKQQGLSAPTVGHGDVTVAPQDNAQTLQLFTSGQIAGGWVPEPWASRLVVEGHGSVLVDERSLWPGGQFDTTCLLVSSTFLQAHPQTVTKLLRAQLDTLATVAADPAAAQASANAALAGLTGKKLAAPVLSRAWSELTLTADPIASSLQTSAAHAAAVGITAAGDLHGIYDLRLLNQLLHASGKPTVSAGGLGQQ